MRHFLSLLFSVLAIVSYSQTGQINGKVIDEKSGEELFGAVVQLEGLFIGANTDGFGDYSIKNITPGIYTVECKMTSYHTKKITGVEVKADGLVSLNISLQDITMEIAELEIVAYRDMDTEASVLLELKEAKGVVSGVGSTQIQKSPDRDASEVARRIPGVTIIDNRFVMVRGLTERYNAVMINNALAPSFESDVRSFSFDVIPSSSIERFLIYKSPSPDLPGEFAGGAINVFTKSFPDEEFFLGFDAGIGFRHGTTGKNFMTNVASSTDWLGYDDGMRQLPSDFPENVRDITDPVKLQALGRSLPNNWDNEIVKAPIDGRYAVNFGKKFKLNDKLILGNVTNINYSNTNLNYDSYRKDYNTFDAATSESDTIFSYADNISQKQAKLGVMMNWGLKIGKRHSIEFRNFLNQTGTQENTLRTGTNFEEGSLRKEYAYRYNQRTIFSSQLSGGHEVFGKLGKINWTVSHSLTRRSDPDWRRIRYTLPLDGSFDQYQAYIPFSAQPFYLGRLFINLNEDVWMTGGSYEHKLKLMKEDKDNELWWTVKGGFYLEDKQRTFGVRNLGYSGSSFSTYSNQDLVTAEVGDILATENINYTNGFKLDEDTKGSDSYTASNSLTAGYLMTSIPYKNFILTGGVRVEHNKQQLNSTTIQNKPLEVIQDSTLILPSANISYNFNEKSLIRAAFGKTVNRPEFRELAPYYFFDFIFNSIYSGNDSLQFATVMNYDVRYERYARPGEFFSVGAFYKDFTNPIEMYFAPGVGSGGTRSFVPGNAPSAISYGVELDLRKSLSGVTSSTLVDKFSVVANASLIKSIIKLDSSTSSGEDGNINSDVKAERPMMGQSPYVFNGGIYFQDDSLDLGFSVLYNVVGPRIVIVGIPGVPEVYEMQRHTIDMSVSKGITKNWSVKLGVQDILNQDTLLLQDANADGKLNKETDQVMQSFNRGTYFTLTLKYRFTKK